MVNIVDIIKNAVSIQKLQIKNIVHFSSLTSNFCQFNHESEEKTKSVFKLTFMNAIRALSGYGNQIGINVLVQHRSISQNVTL